MQLRFLLGPAGSGKTFACLQEIRRALIEQPAGPPLVLLAPKQATFQLERQLLEDVELGGYTRLQILSFDRLASFILTQLSVRVRELLAEEGRLMVLRALLAREREGLSMYRASAHQPGFAAQLSQLLREMQRARIGPVELAKLVEDETVPAYLRAKLADLARLAAAYREWLQGQNLNDADEVLELAAKRLKRLEIPSRLDPLNPPPFFISGLWLDGFAEMTAQEVELLAALIPFCRQVTLAFCLPAGPGGGEPKFSLWDVVGASYARCRERLAQLPDCEIVVEVLERDPGRSRFAASPALAALEARWDERRQAEPPEDTDGVRLIACTDRDTEAVYAAREIRRHVRAGGRYREVTVLVRDLQDYGHVLRRVFTHYGIPFFLDQRESAAHHPVAELTRFALRTLAYNWQREDWFGLLKTGLCGVGDGRIDWLENLALAFGWEGAVWKARPGKLDIEGLEEAWEQVRVAAVLPVLKLGEVIEGEAVSGRVLAQSLRGLWSQLKVSRQLERWSEARWPGAESRVYFHEPAVVHRTVWEQMNAWLANLEMAFADETVAMSLREWLPIIEAGLGNLSIGVIPPAIDQVMVGAVDRTRNPEIEVAFVMGLNEGVFPAVPGQPVLLTESEREQLGGRRLALGQVGLQQLANERYLGYIACTRPQKRLHLTWAATDERGRALPWSSIIDHVARTLKIDRPETFSLPLRPDAAEHYSEVVADVMRKDGEAELRLRQLPKLAEVADRWTEWQTAQAVTQMSPELTKQMFPTPWKTSVSALETFSQCPFRFYARYGLRAKERQHFEPDVREKGSYQHDVLEEFHHRAMKLGGWDRLDVDGARALVTDIADELRGSSAQGKMDHDEVTRFQADNLVINLEKLVTSIVGWMGTYAFRPEAAELGFGLDGEDGLPAMEIDLGAPGTMLLRGRIDRVDLLPTDDDPDTALVAIADYKSSPKAVDEMLLANGLQLQLLSYLHVVQELPGLAQRLGKRELIPAGVFYVGLRPGNGKSVDRDKIVADESAWQAGFQHQGRLNAQWLDCFDSSGGKSRQFKSRGKDHVPAERFDGLRKMVVAHVRALGGRVMSGEVAASPYRHNGAAPCDYCEFIPVCRFDSWETEYRSLQKPAGD